MRRKTYFVSIAIALGVGVASALLTRGGMDVFQGLNKPPLTPPAFIFPVVWTALYVLMGISAALVYEKGGPGAARALRVYAVQLAANFVWSLIFFNSRAYLAAFLWLVLLWGLIVAMIVSFSRVSPLAAKLQLPYLAWVTFAGYLNLMIVLLN